VREDSLKFYRTLIFCPIFKFVEGLILFNLHSLETVVLFLEAIEERVSPRLTLWNFPEELDLELLLTFAASGDLVGALNFLLSSANTGDFSAF